MLRCRGVHSRVTGYTSSWGEGTIIAPYLVEEREVKNTHTSSRGEGTFIAPYLVEEWEVKNGQVYWMYSSVYPLAGGHPSLQTPLISISGLQVGVCRPPDPPIPGRPLASAT